MNHPLRRFAGVLVLAAIASSGPAWADWKESFREGVKAYDDQNWNEVARHMREAIADRPSADRAKVLIFSSRRIAYVPNTFLAIALSKLGQCEQALPYFDQAQIQNVAPTLARQYYNEMVEAEQGCQSQLMSAAMDRAQSALQKAQEVAKEINTLASQPGATAVLQNRVELRNRRDQAVSELNNATSLIELGIQEASLEAIRRGVDSAQKAEGYLVSVRNDLRSAAADGLGESLQRAQRAVASAQASEQSWNALLNQDGANAVFRAQPNLRRDAERAGEMLRRAEAVVAKPGATGQELTTAIDQANRARGAFDQTASSFNDRLAAVSRTQDALEQATRTLQNSIRAAEQALGRLDGYRQNPVLAAGWSGEDRLGGRERQFRSDLERARAVRDQGGRDLGALRQAAQSASTAQSGFASIARDAEAILAASQQGTIASPGGEQEIPDDAAGPPAALIAAVDAYFAGDYEGALRQLEASSFDDLRAQGQRHLFLAASHFALDRMGGGGDAAASDRIQREIGLAKNADPLIEVSRRYFPPPFVELFRGR